MKRALAASLCAFVAGCAAGSTAEALRPPMASGAKELGEESCRPGESVSTFVVDLPSAERHELEAAMHDGVAVVSFDCERFRVLSRCDLEGTYGYVALTPRQEVVRLRSGDELEVNLPLSGIGLAAKLGVDTSRGMTLDIGMALVGKLRTVRASVDQASLRGDCAQATHFVRGASVGAFAVAKGAAADVRAAAEVFGVGAAGGSTSARELQTSDGDLAACKSDGEAATPPKLCGAPVRLELVALGAVQMAVPELEVRCPSGTVLADGRCTAPAAAGTHVCRYGDAADCDAQCAAGNADSCWSLGHMRVYGAAVTRDDGVARPLLEKACRGGSGGGCKSYGWVLEQGRGGPADLMGAARAYQTSCELGHGEGCMNLGVLVENGKHGGPADRARAAALYERGCNAGDPEACVALGAALDAGFLGARDAARSAMLYRNACDAGSARGCAGIGNALVLGAGVGSDRAKGIELLQRGCRGGNAWGCSILDRLGAGR